VESVNLKAIAHNPMKNVIPSVLVGSAFWALIARRIIVGVMGLQKSAWIV